MSHPLYVKKEWVLDAPNREIKDWLLFDTCYVEHSDADLDKVYISIDNLAPIRLSAVASGINLGFPRPTQHLVKITWESSEDGKTLKMVFGREKFVITALSVRLLQDLVGLAKEETVVGIKTQTDKLQFDSDKDLYVASRAKEGGPIDYTTTNDWNGVELDVSQYDEVTIMIKNTGDTNSADIEVYTKANSAGQIEYKEYSATLAPGDVAKVQLNGRYAKAIIRAKSTTADNPTTLRVEWIGGK